VLVREDVEVQLHALRTMTEKFQLYAWTVGSIWLPNLSTYVLRCNNSAMKGKNGTSSILYHDTTAKTITELPRVSLLEPNHAFRILGFLGCSPNVNSSWCRNGVKDDSSGNITLAISVVLCPNFMVVTPSFTHLSITSSNRRFSNYNPTVDVGSVKLTS
jgi:hypothetical protein